MIVDTHAHFIPQPLLDALAARPDQFPSVELEHFDGDFKLAFAGGSFTRPVSPGLRDPQKRRDWMSSCGIDIQVCGGWLDSFGYEIPAEEGAAWSRFMNEHLMAGARATGALAPLATVPLQNGALAAEVLREALDAGFNGVMIGTQPKGAEGNLDDPDLDPFWQTASDLGATVYVHPMFGCGDPRLLDYDMINAVGRGVDTSTAIARMLYAGHFTKYAGMKVVLSHGGGAIPYMMGRLSRNADIHPGKYAHPAEGFGKLYFDTVLFDPAALRFLIEKAGADKVVLGSDYPFPIGDMEPCKIVHDAGLTEIDTNAILGDTAAKLFHLEGGCGC
ncbi:MAG: amidohydrolase [Rhodospirillales bacterium]|nr:amidohydrolase [Rhodospirillales bacterium]